MYTTSLLKSSLCPPLRTLWANDYKGKGISGRDHYINLFKGDGRHRMHCSVSTDTDLYSLTKGKSYLANQRWRRSTCLRDQCYDVGCHQCTFVRVTVSCIFGCSILSDFFKHICRLIFIWHNSNQIMTIAF